MSESGQQTYSLKEAALAIGVAPITLKRWMLSGRVRDVPRDRNGWRVFTELDIARLGAYTNQRSPALDSSVAEAAVHDANFSVASFFSGIGGFDLGFERAGFQISFQCEIDEICRQILEQHWPGVQRKEDIKELTSADVPISDVWVGGFPCQDVSLARMGKRKGLRGSKSGLFFDFARLIGEARPRVVVIENVPGLLSSHGGRDFEIVLRTLADLGYSVGWRTLNSRYFGVPQSRQRVFVVGCYRDRRGPAAILFEPERSARNPSASRSNEKKVTSPFEKIVGNPRGEGVIQSIAYCLYACSARHTGTDWSRNYVCYPEAGEVRRLTPRECEDVMAFPRGWTALRKNAEVEDIDSPRYYALGNAVTPPVAEWLGLRTADYLRAIRGELPYSQEEALA